VYKDIQLSYQYLFKAGGVVNMPSHILNREYSSWGDHSDRFDHARFMAQDAATAKASGRQKGFMSFGVSPNICPGRHFASGEVLALAAMVILRYDILPESGAWNRPKVNANAIAASISPPLKAFKVKVTEREEYMGTTWAFNVTEGKGKFNLVIG
jgi:cytochrome P450